MFFMFFMSSSCENLLHLKIFLPDVVLPSSSDDSKFVEFYKVKESRSFPSKFRSSSWTASNSPTE